MKARSIAAISAAIGLVAMACSSTSDSNGLPDSDAAPTADSTATASIDVEGHRGARGTRPENTLPSFEAALDAGVNTLELDLHLSRDGELVI
ncbi:MAG: glycerophosphodiester phosphodiesterase family protein, partial [Acidimicrobiia bacterium]